MILWEKLGLRYSKQDWVEDDYPVESIWKMPGSKPVDGGLIERCPELGQLEMSELMWSQRFSNWDRVKCYFVETKLKMPKQFINTNIKWFGLCVYRFVSIIWTFCTSLKLASCLDVELNLKSWFTRSPVLWWLIFVFRVLFQLES